MQFTAAQIADLIGGQLKGNPSVQVHAPNKVELAQAGEISFIANPKYAHFIHETKASVLVVGLDFDTSANAEITYILTEDPYSAFSELLAKLDSSKNTETGIHPTAFVSSDASVHESAWIGPNCVVESGASVGANSRLVGLVYVGKNASVGADCQLFAGVKVYNDCVLGDRVTLHSNTVIGSDGFGFAPQADGSYKKVPQTGNVVVEDDVEMGSNCSIDRAMMGSTRIGKGAKLDNLVQIAHNVEIGPHTVIAAQAGISGSTKVGANCVVGGQAGFAGHITVADRSQIGAQSGVNRTIKEPGKRWNGTPLMEYMDQMRMNARLRKIGEFEAALDALKKEISALKEKKD